jgi:predicted helicase
VDESESSPAIRSSTVISASEEADCRYKKNGQRRQPRYGLLSIKDGDKIFGSGSRTPIAITILEKKKK